jgi:NAD(P)-dependent dehydrogenase (short-subunit alcohol dehydrogenase family)
MPPIALVTGSNAGIGRATALALAEKGYRVYASCRDPRKAQDLIDDAVKRKLQLQVLPLDVSDAEQCRRTIETILAAEERIDLLVNNAGYGVMGAIEEVDLAEVRKQFDTNVFGLLQLTQLVLPIMRKRRQGRIINVSSVAGSMSVPAMGAYCASKFAVEALSDALRLEVAAFGIKVVVIQPGPIDTGFENRSWGAPDARPYDAYGPYAHVYKAVEGSTQDFKRFMLQPSAVADVIVRAATARSPEPRYTVTLPAALTPLARKLVPERIMDTLTLAMMKHFGPPGRG